MKSYRLQKNRGASLVLTVLILTTVFVITFGVTNLLLGEIKLSQRIPKSLKAYYAAESGIERSLYDDRQGAGASDIVECSVNLDNGSSYGVEVSGDTTIKSWGCYSDIKRAVEVSY